MDPNNFLISGDYPLDKIVYFGKSSGAPTTMVINHSLGYAPLFEVVWSLDSGFSDVYGFNSGPVSISPFSAFSPILTEFSYSDSTNIQLEFGNAGLVSNVYVRVFGFMPSNINVPATATSGVSGVEDFIINSDYNYTKLALAGVTNSSSTPSSQEVIAHNLGYIPQSRIWREESSKIYPIVSPFYFTGTAETDIAVVDDTSVTLTRGPYISTSSRFHYRIYADKMI